MLRKTIFGFLLLAVVFAGGCQKQASETKVLPTATDENANLPTSIPVPPTVSPIAHTSTPAEAQPTATDTPAPVLPTATDNPELSLPPAPMAGSPAPDLTLPDLANNEHRLSDFEGQMVLLNFWATW